MSTAEAAERLAEIVEAQSALIQKMVSALGQFEEFEKELHKINRMPRIISCNMQWKGQLRNGQKSRGVCWQKLAEEYKICTLHVSCHSQVKHMRIPMASALSRFPLQRLSTGYSHFIDGFPQIRQGFMGVNAFRHSRAGVSEYHLDGRFIGSCSVEHCGQRVAALMGRVVHVQPFYGVVKEAAEGFVVVTGADFSSRFPLHQHGQDFLVDGYFADPRQRLALLDVDVLLA